jgi:hypothetical protein
VRALHADQWVSEAPARNPLTASGSLHTV